MRFKRDWKVLHRDLYGIFPLIFLVLTFWLFVPFFQKNSFSLIALLKLIWPFLCLILFAILCYYRMGYFTNIITFDDTSITFSQRGKIIQQINWKNISKVIRTRYVGGKAIVFWDNNGRQIWFYNSRKIEKYIVCCHPELKSLFPPEGEYRKWESWDTKLRF